MANIRAERVILSDRVNTYRRDYETIGALFRIKSAVLASQESLDPNISVKALNQDLPKKDKKDSEKRTSGTGVEEQLPELRYAPNGKRGRGDVLKLHVTPRDLTTGNEPNFGWIPAPEKKSEEETRKQMRELLDWKKRRPKVRVRSFRADPRTGQRVEDSGVDVEVKGLGRKLNQIVPGGNLSSRAAGAVGVLTDANGKFRCPPGTPAANQFTDEFGTNCFKPALSSRRLIGAMRRWFDKYVELGEQIQLLESMGIYGVGPDDLTPQYRQNIRNMVRAAGSVAPKERVQEVQSRMDTAIDALQTRLGTTRDTTDNADMWTALATLAADEWQDLDFSGIFSGPEGWGSWNKNMLADPKGRTPQAAADHTADVRSQYISMFDNWVSDGPMRQRYRDGDPEARALIDEMVTRHLAAERGFLKAILQEYQESPEIMRQVKTLGRTQIRDGEAFDDYWRVDGECSPAGFHPRDGFALNIDFNAAAVALKPAIQNGLANYTSDGRILLFDIDPNDVSRSFTSEAEQWAEIGNLMQNTVDLERWRNVYAQDLSTARHGSIEAKGVHIAKHELGHARQYQFIKNAVLDTHAKTGSTYLVNSTSGQIERLDVSPDQWTNQQWVDVVTSQVQRLIPEKYLADGFPPTSLETFEGTMLHIMAGRYYQDEVQNFFNLNDDAKRGQSALMMLEGMTELRALRDMGVLMDPELDRLVSWMDDVDPRTPERPDPQGVIWPPPTSSAMQVFQPDPNGTWDTISRTPIEDPNPFIPDLGGKQEHIDAINSRISSLNRSLPDAERDLFDPRSEVVEIQNGNDVVEQLRSGKTALDIENLTVKKQQIIDREVLAEDIAATGEIDDVGDLEVGDAIRFKGFKTLDRRMDADQEQDLSADEGKRKVNFVLPKGTKGIEKQNPANNEPDQVEIPGGEYEVRSVNPDGTVTLVPRSQDDADTVARRLIDSLDGSSDIDDVRDAVRTVQKRAQKYVQKKEKIRRATRSSDPATAQRMERRNAAIVEEIRQRGANPFRVTDRDIERIWGSVRPGERPPFTRAQAEEAYGRALETIEDLRGRPTTGRFGRALEATDEVREFLETARQSEIGARIERAVMEYHNGFDSRPRYRTDMDGLQSIIDTGDSRGLIPPRGSQWDPFLDAEDAMQGFTPDDGIRPLFGNLLHADDDSAIQRYLDNIKGYAAIRDSEFFDRVTESPLGKVLTGDVELVLRADVARRTGYGIGDARGQIAFGVMIHDDDPARVRQALLTRRFGGPIDDTATTGAALDFLHADLTGDYSGIRTPMDTLSLDAGLSVDVRDRTIRGRVDADAFIAGGFNGEELENVRIGSASLNYKRQFLAPAEVGANNSELRKRLGLAGLSQTEVDTVFEFAQSGRLDLESADLLRMNKAAREQADRFARVGISTTFTNDKGINVLDGASVSVETPGIGRIEASKRADDILRVRLEGEIAERAEDIAKQIRSGVGLRSATSSPRRDAPINVVDPFSDDPFGGVVDRARTVVTDRIRDEVSERATTLATEKIGRLGAKLSRRQVQNRGIQRVGMNVLQSDRAENLLRRAGLETDDIENIRFVGELAAAFGTSGPAGVGLVLARRGSREGIDFGVRKAREQGWITDSQANAILRAADTVAPEGLPDAVTNAIGEQAQRAINSDAADRAREIASAAAERVRELDLGDRVGDIFDRGRTADTPALPSTPNDPFSANDPFAPISGGGLRSQTGRSILAQSKPIFDIESDDDINKLADELRTLTQPDSRNPNNHVSIVAEELRDIIGDIETPDLLTGEPRKYAEDITDSIPSYIANRVREQLGDMPLSDEQKQRVGELLAASEQMRELDAFRFDIMQRRTPDQVTDTNDPFGGPPPRRPSAPPPRRPTANDPFSDGPEEVPETPPQYTAAQARERLDEILADSTIFTTEFNQRQATITERENRRSEVETRRQELESVINELARYEMVTADRLTEEIDRTAPVGKATTTQAAKIDPRQHAPQQGIVRDPKEVQRIAEQTVAPAADLTLPEHRDELRTLLLENENITKWLGLIQERTPIIKEGIGNWMNDVYALNPPPADWDVNEIWRESGGLVGARLTEALIRSRGYDAPAMTVNEAEMDLLLATRGLMPISRGATNNMQRATLDSSEEFLTGGGIDGAGLYFAIEGTSPTRLGGGHHEADGYIEGVSDASVIRGALNPGAKVMQISAATRMAEEYRLETLGEDVGAGGEANPLIALRRSLVNDPSQADLLEALDSAIVDSTDPAKFDGGSVNGRTVIPLLLGYDATISETRDDNRVVILNRSAAILQDTTYTGQEWAEAKPWDRLLERAKVLGADMDIPIGLSPEERTQWVLEKLETEFGAISG